MCSIVCSLSGGVPEEPVMVPSGHVYERRLIEAEIKRTGKCPVTGDVLSDGSLTKIVANPVIKPRTATATSIPALMSTFQTEWDALMLETFELRQHNETVRQQLSHALYQHDAACRVIGRLIKERDQARANVSSLQQQVAEARMSSAAGVVVGEVGLTEDVKEQISQLAQQLSKGRKGRTFPNLQTGEALQKLKQTHEAPIHASTKPGITCVHVSQVDDSRLATGGEDGDVVVFDTKNRRTGQKLSGHKKKVTCVSMHAQQPVLVSGSEDCTLKLWAGEQEANWFSGYKCHKTISLFQKTVTACSFHPIGTLTCSASLDGSWALHDLNSGACLRHVQQAGEGGYSSCVIHPDGQLMTAGTTKGNLQVWDLKAGSKALDVPGHNGDILSQSFSENGYFLATGCSDGVARIWDMRKNTEVWGQSDAQKGAVRCVRFDKSGKNLATASSSVVSVWSLEGKVNFQKVHSLSHASVVTACDWGRDAATLVSGSKDNIVRIFQTA